MAKLKDMRRSMEPAPMPMSSTLRELPDVPWGLRIRLETEDLKKLGLTDDEEPEIGDEIEIKAVARITSVDKHETEDDKRCCLELSIIKMLCVDDDEEPDDDEDD